MSSGGLFRPSIRGLAKPVYVWQELDSFFVLGLEQTVHGGGAVSWPDHGEQAGSARHLDNCEGQPQSE